MIGPKNYMRRTRRQALQIVCLLLGNGKMTPPANLVVVAPHPDDEVLGCAGLIAQVKANQGKVHVVLLTGGEKAHDNCCRVSPAEISRIRRHLAVSAGAVLGLSEGDFTFLDWPDGQLQSTILGDNDCARQLNRIIMSFQADALYCPHPFEGWPDHVAAEKLTRKIISGMEKKPALYHYCVWFWYSMSLRKAFSCDWKNKLTLDIKDVYPRKQKSISYYMQPCAPCGKPWSGMLPEEFLNAFTWDKEIFFKVDTNN